MVDRGKLKGMKGGKDELFGRLIWKINEISMELPREHENKFSEGETSLKGFACL